MIGRLFAHYERTADRFSELRFDLTNPPLEIHWRPARSFRLRRHNPVFWLVHLFLERRW